MGTLLKIGGSILICLILLLLTLRVTGFEPRGCPTASGWTCRLPGLWLRGNLVTTPVTDWSFTDKYPSIKIETRTWYLLPHSVTTYCIAYNGQLYVGSLYWAGLPPFPRGRSWNENVARDPHVRLKIENQLYDRTLFVVTDPAEKAAVLQATEKKYPKDKVPAGGTVWLYRVMPD
jgi:hypothetical protein